MYIKGEQTFELVRKYTESQRGFRWYELRQVPYVLDLTTGEPKTVTVGHSVLKELYMKVVG